MNFDVDIDVNFKIFGGKVVKFDVNIDFTHTPPPTPERINHVFILYGD